MGKAAATRRQLTFDGLADAIAECESLLDSGYQMNGKWTLGQICHHLRLVQDRNMDGFPKWMSLFAPIRPLVRWLLLPKLLRGDSPKGLPTASMFVPPNELDDADEVDEFKKSAERFINFTGKLYPHPGFGNLGRDKMEEIHAAHAAHHFGFLESQTD